MKKLIKILIILFLILNLVSCNAYNSGRIENKKTEISNYFKIKLDTILNIFFIKLDTEIKENSKKIKILEKINSKIKNIKIKKKDNKKLVLILDYLKEKIDEEITKLKGNNISDIKNKAISPEQYQKLLKFGIDTDWAKYKKSIKNYKASDALAFAKKGFDHIRIRYGSDTSVSHLRKVVEDILVNNMIPIIAYDAGEFEENPTEENMQKVIEKWNLVAKELKDESYKLSFDLIIEIGGKLNKDPDKANKLYEKLISKIRETGGKNAKRIILISPVKRSYPENLKLLKIPSKANGYLMAEWHMFAAGPNRCGPYMKWTTGTSEEKEFIKNKIKTALNWSKKNNIPTWVGAWMPGNYNKTFEKGCDNNYSNKEQIEFSTFMAKELKKNKIPFAINADRKFYDREKHEWLKDRKEVLDNLMEIMK